MCLPSWGQSIQTSKCERHQLIKTQGPKRDVQRLLPLYRIRSYLKIVDLLESALAYSPCISKIKIRAAGYLEGSESAFNSPATVVD